MGTTLGILIAVHILGYCIAVATLFEGVLEFYEDNLKSKSKLLNLLILFFWFIFVPEIQYCLLLKALGREIKELIS